MTRSFVLNCFGMKNSMFHTALSRHVYGELCLLGGRIDSVCDSNMKLVSEWEVEIR